MCVERQGKVRKCSSLFFFLFPRAVERSASWSELYLQLSHVSSKSLKLSTRARSHKFVQRQTIDTLYDILNAKLSLIFIKIVAIFDINFTFTFEFCI